MRVVQIASRCGMKQTAAHRYLHASATNLESETEIGAVITIDAMTGIETETADTGVGLRMTLEVVAIGIETEAGETRTEMGEVAEEVEMILRKVSTMLVGCQSRWRSEASLILLKTQGQDVGAGGMKVEGAEVELRREVSTLPLGIQ